MKWVKFILLAQAVLTLIIGIVFFTQFVFLKLNQTADIITSNQDIEQVSDISSMFNLSGYILVIVAFIELIIIIRLVS